MASKVIQALYNDDDVLMHAVKKVRAEHHHIEEVYTPFPVHGLDKAMGLADTRIAITSFLYGCLGLTVAVVMMNFIMIETVSRCWPSMSGSSFDALAIISITTHCIMMVCVPHSCANMA